MSMEDDDGRERHVEEALRIIQLSVWSSASRAQNSPAMRATDRHLHGAPLISLRNS